MCKDNNEKEKHKNIYSEKEEFLKNAFKRELGLIGKDGFEKLQKSNIAVLGLGGVGGYLAEALVRAGIGHLTVVDGDVVDISNLNRQLLATEESIGLDKVEVFAKRAYSINPYIYINPIKEFYTPDNKDFILLKEYDYICDAIDMVKAKVHIIKEASTQDISLISAMGTGNKIFPENFKVSKLNHTKVCPLAKVVRKELRGFDTDKIKVVYSEEEPASRSIPPDSISFVPASSGLIMAGTVIRDIIGRK